MGALFISAVAHATVAVTIGAVVRRVTLDPSEQPVVVDVDIAPPSRSPAEAPLPGAESRPSSAKPDVVRRRSISAPRGPVAPTPAAMLSDLGDLPLDQSAQRARFTLSAKTVAAASSSSSSPVVGEDPGREVLAEGDVSVPARLVTSSPLVYPRAARSAEIEVDVPLEIVVGVDGRVSAARALTRVGYGLEDAALSAIRAYRFSPALRAGVPVRVRMLWTVQFRLG